MKFEKIRQKKISDIIYEQIKKMILTAQLAPAERLPSERELAAQLGVSRPSLREALHKLEAQGFLTQNHGDGTYVKSLTSQTIDKAMEEFIKREDAIVDLMEVRKILETWAAKTAAMRASDEEIANMKEYLDEMRSALDKGEVGHIPDANFHNTISYATNNILLIHIMNTIYQWVEKVSYEVRSRLYTDNERFERLYLQHQKIYEGINARDPEEAYKAMLEHMEYVVDEVNEIVRTNK
ncbi:FadR/GntR family transcriptional regulator [Geovibrio ferrireducens]|jgi:GntR family transcriptional repressor for pyruvate dehydrogenase complex|uniref:FadR/GntR family transcriptional regulator n=1 Tax=Geovibrio ferrireducens TaxID=46201 RepID=UPI00224840AE|nr:FadR/GntR family transcriptional regulator [Geovibrio ferrireducens]